jgi:hypothetical protein
MMSRNAIRLFTRGPFKGRRLDIGTAVIPGRDFDVFVSHVLVEQAALPTPFRVMTKGTITRLARLGMKTSPTTTGDAAFDDKWVVDSDHALAISVLDDELRRSLIELADSAPWAGVASIEVTRTGLMLRWPEELTPGSAAYFRDVALRICDGLTRRALPAGGSCRMSRCFATFSGSTHPSSMPITCSSTCGRRRCAWACSAGRTSRPTMLSCSGHHRSFIACRVPRSPSCSRGTGASRRALVERGSGPATSR